MFLALIKGKISNAAILTLACTLLITNSIAFAEDSFVPWGVGAAPEIESIRSITSETPSAVGSFESKSSKVVDSQGSDHKIAQVCFSQSGTTGMFSSGASSGASETHCIESPILTNPEDNPALLQGSSGVGKWKLSSGDEPNAQFYSDPTASVKLQNLSKIVSYGANNLLYAFDGWQFDTTRPGSYFMAQRPFGDPGTICHNWPAFVTPDISSGTSKDLNCIAQLMSLEVLNMGVDDEIPKTAMPVFTAYRNLSAGYVADETYTDDFLDLFSTLRGATILTLSYLDKTVAAGLATVQNDTQQHVNGMLLQQISMATKEMTRPEWSVVFRDVDEKIHACMRQQTETRSDYLGNRLPDTSSDSNAQENVKKACGDHNPGSYEYCVCYAQTELRLNKTTRDLSSDGYYSIVHRVFYGDHGPHSDNDIMSPSTAANRDNLVRFGIEAFIEMYGDVHFVTDEEATNNAVIKKTFHYPLFSVPQRIDVIRNGCDVPYFEGNCDRDTIGICPAIEGLLGLWPVGPSSSAEIKEKASGYFIEASLGKQLSARDIQDWLEMSGQQTPIKTVDGKIQINGQLRRFIDTFCDTQSIAAFKKIHSEMKRRAEAHITINQKASDYEKGVVRGLMGRVDRQIVVAEEAIAAEYAPEERLITASANSGKSQMGKTAANAEGNKNSIAQASRLNSGTNFGGGGGFCFGDGTC